MPPTPKSLTGLTDPARAVRPVDWAATGRRAPGSSTGEAAPAAPAASAAADAPEPAGHGSPSDVLPHRRPRAPEPPRSLSVPPPDAVHTIASEDPRPLPRPLQVVDEQIRTVGVTGLTTAKIVRVVADPEDAWTADAGSSDHFLRGGIVVQVRRADNSVIGAFSTRYALSVRPEDYEPALDIAEDAAGPSARGGKGTRHPTTRRELLRRMESAGFVVTPGSTHGRVTHPDHPGLVVPFASTPSDRRFTRHAVAQIRRVFGIDLRH
ncbi:type II toxin-antitoxin system HicA family toxin [Brachybacterium sp. FME24]|uniref:type II toxin-antitoxin system HicA family toxin n=1 Tax=Brachybacterium sp. FME24 TaxID=2742605 RepID=UPI001865D3FC|nr:type II toxin-antitoxin system HicA family toxin [Brachybacterium sp. FME24]